MFSLIVPSWISVFVSYSCCSCAALQLHLLSLVANEWSEDGVKPISSRGRGNSDYIDSLVEHDTHRLVMADPRYRGTIRKPSDRLFHLLLRSEL